MGLEQIQVELQEWMGSDRQIAEAAWTSSYNLQSRKKKTDEDVERVVKMMAQSGHGTPFEAVVMRFWLRIPIFTDRQHMTHRVATHNGLSGRYRTVPTDYYDIPDDVQDIIEKTDSSLLEKFYESCETAVHNYKSGVEQLKAAEKEGIISNNEFKRVREVWRGQVPCGSMVERVSIFNLRSFANYMRHRLSPHAQEEIQEVARKMLAQVKEKEIAPLAVAELERKDWLLEPDLPK